MIHNPATIAIPFVMGAGKADWVWSRHAFRPDGEEYDRRGKMGFPLKNYHFQKLNIKETSFMKNYTQV